MTERFSSGRYREAFLAATQTLGGDIDVAGPEDFERVTACGRQSSRHFHHLGHFIDISSAADSAYPVRKALEARGLGAAADTVRALVVRAGAHHDLVYLQVDGGIAPPVAAALSPFVNGKPSALRPAEDVPAPLQTVYRQALLLFGAEAGGPVASQPGANELLSALIAGAAGVEAGIAPRHVLSEMAMIEATIPFRQHDRFDGLAHRLALANELLPKTEQLDADARRAVMIGAVQLANHDVSGIRGAYIDFRLQGDQLLAEDGCRQESDAELREACTRQVTSMERLRRIAGAGAIFHAYDGYPSAAVLEAWHHQAIHNIETRRQECRRRLATLDRPATGFAR